MKMYVKRFLSVLLVITMLFSTNGTSVLAAESDETTYTESVNSISTEEVDSYDEAESEDSTEFESQSDTSEPESESESQSDTSDSESESDSQSDTSEAESESQSDTSEPESESSSAAEVNLSASTITLSKTSYTYNGSARKPSVTVTCSGATLKSGTDYTVSYKNNTNAGTATVTITAVSGSGYTGTNKATFTISKATQTITANAANTSIKAGKTTTIKASTTGNGAITFSSGNTSIATVNKTSGKVTSKALGTVKITVTAAATTNYKKATKTVTIKVSGLQTPAISSVTQSKTTVTIKWAKITAAKGYYIYRSTSKSSGYEKVATIKSCSTLSYKDTDSKSNGKTYYYKVYAYSGSTKSSASSAQSIKYMKGSVSSLTNTSSGITVKWTKVSGATGYYIYRKASTADSYTKVKTIKSGSTVSWTDTGIKSKNSTTYTYYVQPYNSSSKGAYATKKTVRLTGTTLSSAANTATAKMTVKWAKKSGITGYQIQYSKSSSFSSGNKTVTISKAATTSTVISSLTKGKTYYVRIRTYKTVSKTNYYSAWSAKKSVKIASGGSSSSKTYTYVLNTSTKKFHYSSCYTIAQMSDSNKATYTGTREEVLDLGYDSCGKCNP